MPIASSFRNAFWEPDFITQPGFETLVSRMKEGRQSCRDVEEFLKHRAKAEEEFAKSLLKIARTDRGPDESGTLRSSLEVLRQESEVEASLHLSHSQQLLEEANKLSEFREKQREQRKSHEDAVHKTQKIKVESYRKLQSCKNSYESKCKAAEKSDSELERLKFGNKQKEIDRARKSALQYRQAAVKADDDYKNSVAQLEAALLAWKRDHTTGCDVFQELEVERIQYLRNTLWVFTNLGSDLCVKVDESRENVRLSLENCDADSDIQDYIGRKATGSSPLSSIPYVPYGSTSNSSNSTTAGGASGHHANTAMLANEKEFDTYCLANYSSIDAVAGRPPNSKYHIALYDYTPRTAEEVALKQNDHIIVSVQDADGWWKGKNLNTGAEGLFPASYVNPE